MALALRSEQPMLIGVDVSQWQGDLGPNTLDFVIVKASEGTGFKDPHFAMHVDSALARGQLVFAYHFGNRGEGSAGAENFLAAIGPYVTRLSGVMCDVEFQDAAQTYGPSYADVQAWNQTVAVALPGMPRYIYTAGFYWTQVLGQPPAPAGTRLWWAHLAPSYNATDPAAVVATVTPGAPDLPWAQWTIRQVGWNASVGGIQPVDLDMTFLTREQLAPAEGDDLMAVLTSEQASDLLTTIGRAVYQLGGVVTKIAADQIAFMNMAMLGDVNRDGTVDHYGLAQVKTDLADLKTHLEKAAA